ncbi:MAG: alpha/beta hydrolase [Gammaproteobacteria bacterium]|jgi:pimeloyl-ACP methyl ester carboxylesterase|nr:alpha/beta hydrolase [Gammaproteobacteria bacterium]MDP6616209.1 alpha/beta hydrolase [Gammaproteobacteria bacterium]MDP6695583.1 alpha/beta hydrolase [Gammaproteobacteria bacterium]
MLGRILVTIFGLLLVVYTGLIIFAYWPYDDGVPSVQLAAPDDKFITADGLQLRYRTWGEPDEDRPSIVLLHGFANSAMSFQPVAEVLAADHYVIALDLPGFGLSDKPADRDYNNATQAKTVIEFIDALGLDEVVIGGHSMGGTHAVRVAINSPVVVGMILFNPGIISTSIPPTTQYLIFPFPRLVARTFAEREFRENLLRSSYVIPETFTQARLDELMLTTRSEGYIEGVTALMSNFKPGREIELLGDVRIPTLIVWGVDDRRKTVDEADKLQKMISGSQLVLVEDAGHFVHEENPADAAFAIRDARSFWASRR